MYEYKLGESVPANSSTFWMVLSFIMFALVVFMSVIAVHCAKPLDCVDMYEEGNIKFCISEVKT